jgi:hypothetical protein
MASTLLLRWTLLALLALGICLGTFPGSSLADDTKEKTAPEDPQGLFVYVDEAGQLHVVSSLGLVPARYRDQARPADLSSGATVNAGPSSGNSRSSRTQPGTGRPRAIGARPSRQTRRASSQAKGAKGTESRRKGGGKKRTEAEARAATLDSLRAERDRALDILGGLEEGWLAEAEANPGYEPSQDELEQRSKELTHRIDQLDERIRQLEQQDKR